MWCVRAFVCEWRGRSGMQRAHAHCTRQDLHEDVRQVRHGRVA